MSSATKPRMLFLHGMFMPPDCYREKSAVVLLKCLDDAGWQVDFLKSPRPCPDDPPAIVKEAFPDLQEFPEWINSETHAEDNTKTYHGLQDSLNVLRNHLLSQPKYDIVAGHSNGALMASILAFMTESTQASEDPFLPPDKQFRGVLLFNAPGSYETERTMSKKIAAYGSAIIQMPSIHVVAESDHVYTGSQRLQQTHHPNDATLVQHSEGHMLPKESQHYDEIMAALQKS
jgi:hypothetical protein